MNRRGVTLVEIMVVVALIGVMSALAVNNYTKATRDSRRTAAVREIQNVLMEARSQARARNQPTRIDVLPTVRNAVPGRTVRWGVLPCNDPFGRQCPSAACGAGTKCQGGCVCDRQSEVGDAVFVPTLVDGTITFTALDGLCFVASSAAPRNSSCDPATAPVTQVRFDLPGNSEPVLIMLEGLTGQSRIVDCARIPREADCP